MELVILQSNFAKALNQTSKIVSARTTLPVLSNILISAEKGKIHFNATDLEIGIKTQTIGKVESEGEITLPAKLLSDFVLNNTDETITLSVDGTKATLKSEKFEATITGISAAEFPSIPVIEEKNFLSIGSKNIFAALKKVSIAPAMDETRPALAGVYFQFNGNDVILAATDSYRLAEAKVQIEESFPEKKIIVPTRAITEFLRLLGGAGDNIKIAFNENQISFKIDDTYIVSRLIEGSYPNYQQIIPDKFKTKIVVKKEELLKAVKMSSLFARDVANNNIKLKISKNLEISSVASQAGESKSQVDCKVEGEGLEIAFNAKYLLDVLQVLISDEIEIQFNDNNSPAVVKEDKDKGYTYLIMPLKVE